MFASLLYEQSATDVCFLQDYALVIYKNPDLEEIGLPSLNRIMNGGVRITKNPKLCYARTVDWWRMIHPDFREKIIVKVISRKSGHATGLCIFLLINEPNVFDVFFSFSKSRFSLSVGEPDAECVPRALLGQLPAALLLRETEELLEREHLPKR